MTPGLLLLLTAAAEPIFSIERGLYSEPLTLDITPSQGGVIRYSLDGGEPDAVLTGSLQIDGTALVSAREVYKDGTSSATITHTYLYLDDVMRDPVMDQGIISDPKYGPIVAETLSTLPIISLVVGGALSTTEQEVSLEWLDPAGESLQVRCGARDVGGHSLNYEKNNIRLSFRGEYGTPRLELDLFADFDTGVPPTDSHDALTLRSGSHDSVFYLGAAGQYARNRWMDESQLELGHIAPHGRYGHLVVDGQYTGLYHVRERFDASLLAAYLGGDEDDYEAVNGGRAVDGSGAAWAAVVAASTDFEAFSRLVDVDNYLDYMILNFFAGNDWDWNPDQNWMAAGPALSGDGVGRFVFHASDNDICLYYDWDINILHEVGPSYTFHYLKSQGHPDFWMRLADRAWALLGAPDGVLTVDENIRRYEYVTDQIEDAVVAESARWGQGWWDREEEWAVERRRLLEDYFPLRTDELLRQFRDAGWYRLDAPELSRPAGRVAVDETVTVSVPDAVTAELLLTRDGTDPRLSGGAISPDAESYSDEAILTIDRSTRLSARLHADGVWGPLLQALYEVDAPAPIVLNEWNAVSADGWLDQDGTDTALGRVAGNGGDWIELLVTAAHLDVRGWTLEMIDRTGPVGTLTFTDEPLLSDLAAGTILTIAMALPEDAAYDPQGGDWRFHLQAGSGGSGRYISATDFSVSHREWRLTILDAEGRVQAGTTGEGVSPADGISSSEVGILAADPDDDLRPESADYTASHLSSFGAPNVWPGGAQDLSALRGVTPTVIDIEDTAAPGDTASDTAEDTASADAPTPEGCACGSTGAPGGLLALGVVLLALRRRRAAVVLLVGCQEPTIGPDRNIADTSDTLADTATVTPIDQDSDGFSRSEDCDDRDAAIHPDAPEVCDGIDNDCDEAIDDADDDLVDGLPFFADGDGDGYGGAQITACTAEGHALVGGDCDDTDASVSPGAVELCDGVDRDCDGSAEDSLGASSGCAADSCRALLAAVPDADDGAYWLSLASGGAAAVYCDMTTDGGGWTLGFVRNTASTGSQGDFGAGDVDVAALSVSPESASSDSTPRLGWLDLNELPFDALRLSAYSGGVLTWTSADIPTSDLRIPFGADGYRLYGEGGYYWCGGDASYTDSGVGAVDNPPGAPLDCRGHSSLGSGWDFSDSTAANAGLTLCGGDGSAFLSTTWGGGWTYYGTAGGAQAIWVR